MLVVVLVHCTPECIAQCDCTRRDSSKILGLIKCVSRIRSDHVLYFPIPGVVFVER